MGIIHIRFLSTAVVAADDIRGGHPSRCVRHPGKLNGGCTITGSICMGICRGYFGVDGYSVSGTLNPGVVYVQIIDTRCPRR
jgi:hypothetical protein